MANGEFGGMMAREMPVSASMTFDPVGGSPVDTFRGLADVLTATGAISGIVSAPRAATVRTPAPRGGRLGRRVRMRARPGARVVRRRMPRRLRHR